MIRNRTSADGMYREPDGIVNIPLGNAGSSSSTRSMVGRQWYLLIGILVFGVMIYSLLLYSSPLPWEEHTRTEATSHEQITILMNTFKRHDMMLDAVDYYSSCGLVKYIYIIWSESEPPPQRLTARFATTAHPKVAFNIHKMDSLNNRFKPITDGPHTDAIFSVDDDMRVPCADLNLAYDVWRGSRYSLVGFMPRIHLRRGGEANGKLEYRCWWRVWWHGIYSIILTKAAFFHHDFLVKYTHLMDASVRDLVDKRRNCEDIAMQFLIANETSLPPIYVRGNLDDLGVLNGISTDQNIVTAGHMHERSDCLNDLEQLFHGVPLVPSRIIVDSASNKWKNWPSTWYEFISSDLWKW